MSPPSVTITQLEPVIFLRGQSASGQDARGRRRPVNIDAPPSQLRALITLQLPKPSKVKEITVSLTGTARTDWPEGIGPNRLETVEEVTIFKQVMTIFNAKEEGSVPGRRRSNSVGPGIGLQEDVDWDYAAAAAHNTALSRSSASVPRMDGARNHTPSSNGSNGSNLARQIAEAAAKAGTAIIPPTLRPDISLFVPKDTNSSRSRPPLQRTGSGTTSWSHMATSPDARNVSSPSHFPASRFYSPSPSNSPDPRRSSYSFTEAMRRETMPNGSGLGNSEERGRSRSTRPDLNRWQEYFESQGQDQPPLYAPRSAPLEGYDSWPAEPLAASSSYTDFGTSNPDSQNASATVSASSSNGQVAPANVNASSPPRPTESPTQLMDMSRSNSAAPAKGILHNQPNPSPRPRDHSVRFDPQFRVDPAPPTATNSSHRSVSRSAPNSRPSSMEVVTGDKDKSNSKAKPGSKTSLDNKLKKPGLKNLINGLLKEPESKAQADAGVSASESKEFKKGTYTYPICISLPSNLPPTLHADFGFNRYTLKTSVVRSGALAPNLLAEREITLIHAPDEDEMDETDSIVVERCWEDVLSYMVVFSGKSFPVGQKIPLWIKFVPLGKIKIHRILATLEERTDYFAKGRRVARHEVPRKWTLLKLAHTTANEPILPILSDSADALERSPLAPLARAAAAEDLESDKLPSILDPTGPWELATDLMIPACGTTRINLSSNHSKSNIAVHHLVRLAIRVEKPEGVLGDGTSSTAATSGKDHKLYDIVIEAPITLTHSHTATEWTALPNYWSLPAEPIRCDEGNNAEIDAPIRPNLPAPVLSSRTGLVGATSPTLSARGSSTGQQGLSPLARNPAQLSRRWLALSAEQIGRDGITNPSSSPDGRAAPPPPAYQPNARTGETIVSSSDSAPGADRTATTASTSTPNAAPNVGLAH